MKKAIIIGIGVTVIIGVAILSVEQMNQFNETVPVLNIDNENTNVIEDRQGKHFTVGITESVGITEP